MELQQPMKLLDRSRFSSLSVLSCAFFSITFHAAAWPVSAVLDVEYFDAGDPSYTGIGFIADKKSLFVGGCRTFDLESKRLSKDCRFPADTRWGNVSPDGSLVLITTVEPRGSKATSLQLDAVTGRVLSTRKGIQFAPPVAIHPSNNYWAVARAGKDASASETVTIVDRQWKVRKSGIYAETQRIFALSFSVDGSELLVNGGGPLDGATLETSTWRAKGVTSSSYLMRNAEGTVAVIARQKALVLIDPSTGADIQALDLDVSGEELQAALSPDGQWFAAKGYRQEVERRRYVFALVRLKKP
jgi:hypothetical protein